MSLLQMSFSGAAMILTVVVIRALALHKLPKNTFLVLWGVVLVRLLVPYSVPSAFSVYSLVGRLTSMTHEATAIPVAPAGPTFPLETMPGTTAFAPKPSVPAVDPWAVVWLIGVLGCGIFFAAAYFKCRREFRASLPVGNDYAKRWLQTHRLRRPVTIRQSDRISAPLTYGVFRPVILMPKTTDWADEEALAYVLGHEYVHIRRFDAVTKLALTSALCVHWFNPMVWIMYVLANRDIELSCDEAVIRGFGERTKSAYAMMLIRMEETRSGLSPLCNNFSKNAIEERIVAIMKIKKTSLVALFVAIALVIGVTTAFATSGQTAAAKGSDGNIASDHGNSNIVQEGTAFMDAQSAKIIANSEWFPNYEQYGLSYDEQQSVLQYDGEVVNFFHDETSPGVYTHVSFNRGTVGVEVQRNADWEITGLAIRSAPTDGAITQEGSLEQTAVAGTTTFFGESAYEPTQDELLAEYGKFGISFDASSNMLYQGKLVRWFADFVELEEGALATRYVYRNDEGTEYIHTVRDRIDNGDGSYDLFGPVMEIVPWEAGKRDDFGFLFQGNHINEATTTTVSNSQDVGGTTFEEHFAKYKDYGITYVEAPNASGRGNVYLNGQLVSRFSDVSPDGSAFSFTSADKGGIAVRTVYDSNEQLTGVETIKE